MFAVGFSASVLQDIVVEDQDFISSGICCCILQQHVIVQEIKLNKGLFHIVMDI
jgi:hypothetical protein